MKITKPNVQLVYMEDYATILKKLEMIGRVCYKSEHNITNTSAEPFISAILQRGHESVIEHENVTIRITCDRGVTHEIVRHRLASYSQESTRYCNYGKDQFENQIQVIDIATGFRYDFDDEKDVKKYAIWIDAMEYAEKQYFALLDAGATPQEARSVLPNSLKTEIVATMNLRQWRHFLKMRTAPAAHPQMREIADQIYDLFKLHLPVFVSHLS